MSETGSYSRVAAVNRRQFVATAAAAGVAGAAGPLAGGRAWGAPAVVGSSRPNLLFINVDQMSQETLEPPARRYVRTPNIDRLASRGTSFSGSYSADPVCCPARSSWVTGRMTCETGVVMNSMPMLPDLPDIGQWLRQEGYETIHVGKWHVSGRDAGKGFNVLHGGCPIGEHGDGATALACEGFLRNRKSGQPFFLMAGLLNPHDICYWLMRNGRSAEPLYDELVTEAELPPLPPNFQFDSAEPETFASLKRGSKSPWRQWTERSWRHYAYAYYRYVEMVDAMVGRIVDALEDSPHAANTIVILTADHGDGHGRHQMTGKGYLYDSAARVPLIVSCPGRLPEGRLDATHLASGVDMTPTLCDFAGVAPPPNMRGYSLRPALEQRPVEWRAFVESQSAVEGRMIRTADYKYIAYRNDKTVQLFDMKNDPWETKNLAGDSRHAGTLEAHRRLLQEWEATLAAAPASKRGLAEIVQSVRQNKARQTQRLDPAPDTDVE